MPLKKLTTEQLWTPHTSNVAKMNQKQLQVPSHCQFFGIISCTLIEVKLIRQYLHSILQSVQPLALNFRATDTPRESEVLTDLCTELSSLQHG